MHRAIAMAPAAAVLLWLSSSAAAELDGIYGSTPLTAEPAAPPLPGNGADEGPRPRSFPGQPPTTPHPIYDDYKFGLTENRCLLCHSPSAPADMIELTRAPSVGSSHLVRRDGKIAADVTPGRRFCASCHIVQTDALPPVGNTFGSMSGAGE